MEKRRAGEARRNLAGRFRRSRTEIFERIFQMKQENVSEIFEKGSSNMLGRKYPLNLPRNWQCRVREKYRKEEGGRREERSCELERPSPFLLDFKRPATPFPSNPEKLSSIVMDSTQEIASLPQVKLSYNVDS